MARERDEDLALKNTDLPKGMKHSDFKSMEDVLGDDANNFRDAMPEGVRFYIKEQLNLLQKRNAKVMIYRIEKQAGETKETLAFLETVSDVPDEDFIKGRFGVGRYRWIAKWNEVDGKKGIMSEPICIADDSIRARPELQMGSPQFPMYPVSAPPSIPQRDPYELAMQIFDRMGAMMERLVPKRESGMEVADRIADKLATMSMKQFERDVKLGENVKRTMIEATQARESEIVVEDEISVPSWLKPFVPIIQEAIPALLGGGITGKFAKTALLGSDDFTQIMQDPERWNELLKAISGMYPDGAEKVLKIVEILNAPAPDPNVVSGANAANESVSGSKSTKAKTK